MRQNKTVFRASIQLGGGAALEDFSRLLGFDPEQTKVLAQVLRKNREFVNKKVLKNPTIEKVENLLSLIENEMS